VHPGDQIIAQGNKETSHVPAAHGLAAFLDDSIMGQRRKSTRRREEPVLQGLPLWNGILGVPGMFNNNLEDLSTGR
jgi:hypothetical protein